MDEATRKDMYAKYSLLADAYAGTAGEAIVKNNKLTYQVLLSNMMIDFMLYLNAGGNLAAEIANNPNIAKILDNSNPAYIKNIAKSLKEEGWKIDDSVSTDAIKQALMMWGVQSTDDMTNAEVISSNQTGNSVPNISFDDSKIDEEKIAEAAAKELNEQAEQAEQAKQAEQTKQAEQAEQIKQAEQAEQAEQAKQASDEEAGESGELTQEEIDEAAKEVNAQYGSSLEVKEFSDENMDDVREAIEKRDKKFEEAIEAKKAAKREQQEAEAVEKATSGNNVDKAVVRKTLNSIMEVYDVMYAPLFQKTPSGILTTAGLVSVKSDLSKQVAGQNNGNIYMEALSQAIHNRVGNTIRELDYHDEVSIDCINPDGSLKYNYIPSMHIRNIYGIYKGNDGTLKQEKNWTKFRKHLVDNITVQLTKLFELFQGNPLILSNSLLELFTTAFIVEDFNIEKSIQMTVKSLSLAQVNGGYQSIAQLIVENNIFMIDKSSIELVNNSSEAMGVHNILVVFNKKMYNGEILFAYKPLKKILESGGSVGLEKTLLGRDVKGRDVTYNFKSPQEVCSLVIAGSGSGKGVVTLNMLATFIAEGCPTVYVDWKPDMAAMLWNLERKTGARILAIDGLSGRADGVVPVRDYGVGENKPNIPTITDTLNVIPYIKAFQIMVLCAQGRNLGYNGMSSKGKKMFFILDEAQAMNKQLSQLRGNITSYLSEHRPTKNNPPDDKYKYVKKLSQFLDSMFSGSVTFRNTTGRTGNTGVILLGQQSDCTAWATGAIKRDPIGFLVGNCSMKMLGKDATDSTKYSLNGCVPKGNSFLGNMGYFAIVKQAVADKSAPEKIKVVKSYLVLNENDYSPENPGKFTGGMLTNVVDDQLRDSIINDDFYPEDENGNRYVNPLVGFQGLIEFIGQHIPGFDLKKNLEAGYVEVEKLLTGLGILGENAPYSCIEQYLFDCSYNSLYTIDELNMLMKDGETIADLMGDAGSGDGEGGEGGDGGDGPGFKKSEDDPFKMTGNGAQNNGGQQGQNQGGGQQQWNGQNQGGGQQQQGNGEEQGQWQHGQGQNPGQTQGNGNWQNQQGTNNDWYYNTRSLSRDAQEILRRQQEVAQEANDKDGDTNQDAQPIQMPYNDNSTFENGGATGRTLYVTPERSTKILGLTKENSILVTMPNYATGEKFSNRLFKTLWGTKYEFKNRWKLILDTVADQTNANMVKRLTITEDAIVFNKKSIATIDILGGAEDIRIEDIVNFTMTAKKFKNIDSIVLDEIIFETAQIEFGDPIAGLFKTFPNLQNLSVLAVGYGEPIIGMSRNDFNNHNISEKAQKLVEKATFKNQMEVVSAAKNPNLRNKRPGYQNKVWDACKNFQAVGWGSARDAILDKNPKLFKAVGMSLLSVGILAVGGVFGVGGRIIHTFKR